MDARKCGTLGDARDELHGDQRRSSGRSGNDRARLRAARNLAEVAAAVGNASLESLSPRACAARSGTQTMSYTELSEVGNAGLVVKVVNTGNIY